MPIALALLAAAAAAPSCAPRDLSAATQSADGDFNGMQHAGTYLVVANKGSRACRVESLPRLTLLDRRGHALPVRRNAPPGMHPGPVVTPVTLAPGASARTGVRWISGPVFDRNRTIEPVGAALRINGGVLRLPFTAKIYGEAGKPAGFDQPPLELTPRSPARPAAS